MSVFSAQADDKSGKFALSGSVNLLTFENTANAYIGAGAQINQDKTYQPLASQTVKLEAENTIKTVNLAGVMGFFDLTKGFVDEETGKFKTPWSFAKDKLSEFYGTGGEASLGGSYNQLLQYHHQAVIKDGETFTRKRKSSWMRRPISLIS
jgi:hypothetical protein